MSPLKVLTLCWCVGIAACSKSADPALQVQAVAAPAPTSPLEVQLVTDLSTMDFVAVLTEVFPGTSTAANSVASSRLPVEFTYAFEPGRAVATFPSVAHGTYTVRVRLYRRDGQILVERHVQANHARAGVLRVHVTEDCLPSSVSCPAPGGPSQHTECLQGHCVDPRCSPQDEGTHEFCPSVVFCHSDSECPALEGVSACVANKCASGICIPSHLSGAIEGGPHGTVHCNGA